MPGPRLPSRRAFLVGSCLCGVLAAVVFPSAVSEAQLTRGPALEERLLVGLKVRTREDREFVEQVVKLVNQGKLPVKLVDSTFFWARDKASRKRSMANRPMVYFRPALLSRAAKLGISI